MPHGNVLVHGLRLVCERYVAVGVSTDWDGDDVDTPGSGPRIATEVGRREILISPRNYSMSGCTLGSHRPLSMELHFEGTLPIEVKGRDSTTINRLSIAD